MHVRVQVLRVVGVIAVAVPSLTLRTVGRLVCRYVGGGTPPIHTGANPLRSVKVMYIPRERQWGNNRGNTVTLLQTPWPLQPCAQYLHKTR